MTEFKMTRNASGIYDSTAYKGIMSAPKAGEIWAYSSNGREKEVLVIKNQGSFCNVLTLTDDCKNEHCIEVIGRSVKYTDPRMLQYVFNDGMGQYIKKISDEDFDVVLDCIEEALEVEITEAVEAQPAAPVTIINQQPAAPVTIINQQPAAPVTDNIYKHLYDELIDKLIEKKVM